MTNDFLRCFHCKNDMKIMDTIYEDGKQVRQLECGHQSIMHIRTITENIRNSDNCSYHANPAKENEVD